MKVLVFGAKGMLGYAMHSYFERQGQEVKAMGREDFDIARDPISNIESLVTWSDAVINCAGVIKPLIAKTPIEDVLKVNAVFPRNLANLCERHSKMCFHVTTDCVYSGRKGTYSETDAFDAEDVYGLSKNAGDAADAMVLRTSIVGEEKYAKRSLLEWARSQSGKEVSGFVNHSWNGVTTVFLAEIIETIIKRGLYEKGIFHVHSPQAVTKLELLQIFNEVYDLHLKINAVEASEFCDRTLNSGRPLTQLVCTKPLPTQIQEMRKFFQQASPASSR